MLINKRPVYNLLILTLHTTHIGHINFLGYKIDFTLDFIVRIHMENVYKSST